jgi:hypothetical protein
MPYNILDGAEGNVINTINADLEFVQANFDYYSEYTAPLTSEIPVANAARIWRDMELSSSDYIVPLSDHPQRAAYILYRESLRAWPSTDSFPDTRPEVN